MFFVSVFSGPISSYSFKISFHQIYLQISAQYHNPVIIFLKGLSFIPPRAIIGTILLLLASPMMFQMSLIAFAHLSMIELFQILPQSQDSNSFLFQYLFFGKSFYFNFACFVKLTKRPKKIIIEDIKL
jgi:hypothetical protein